MMAPTDEEDEDVLFDHSTYRRKGNSVPSDPVMNIEDDDDDIIFDQAHLLPNHIHQGRKTRDNKCNRGWTTALLFLAFCGLGLCIALPGPTLLDLQERTDTGTEDISRIFIGRSVGYLIGSFIGGLLIDRMNKSFLMSMFLLLTTVGTAIIPWCTHLYLLIITIAFQGIAMGFVDTAGNLMCVQMWGRRSPPYMQALHFFFGLGAFVAPLLAEPFLSTNTTNAVSVNVTLRPGILELDNIITTTPGGKIMGDVIPIAGRSNIDQFANMDLFRRDVRQKNSRYHLMTLTTTDHPSVKKKEQNSDTVGKPLLSSKPKNSAGSDFKTIHRKTKPEISLPAKKSIKPEDEKGNLPSSVGFSVTTIGGPLSGISGKDLVTPILSDSNNSFSPISSATLPTTTQKPKPKKPLTNGSILNHSQKVAGGANIPKKLVEKTKKGQLSVPTKAAPHSTTGKPKTTQNLPLNGTSNPNMTQQATVTSTKRSPTTVAKVSPTTEANVETTKPTTSMPTTPSTTPLPTPPTPIHTQHKESEKPSVSEGNANVELNPDSDWMSLKPTATYINTTEYLSFPTKVKTEVVRIWHYFTTEITKVQFVYLIVSVFLAIIAIMFCGVCCCFRQRRNEPLAPRYNLRHLHQRDSFGFNVQIVLLLFIFNFLYVGMEIAYGALVMSFAVDYLKWKKSDGSFVTALFWGSFAFTRLLSIAIAKCLRPSIMLIIDLVVTSLSLLALLLTVDSNDLSMWICTAFLGIGMASVFPTMLSWAERYISMTGKVTATLIIAAALGEMALPTLTGFLFEAKTPMFLIYILFASSLFCCILYIILQNLASNHGEKYSLLASIPLEEDGEDIELDHVDLSATNTNSNHVASSNNHVGNNSMSGKPVKKVTFNLEDDVQLLKDSSGE